MKKTHARPDATLANVLDRLTTANLTETRRRDLRSAVKRVAMLLGDEVSRIVLDIPAISGRLAMANPVSAGLSAKRLSNIRSDFLAAVKASGFGKAHRNAVPSPAWVALFDQAPSRRVSIGLSRLARFASCDNVEPSDVNDAFMDRFAVSVAEQTLHRKPARLRRQVSVIWNELAKSSRGALQTLTIPAHGPGRSRLAWSALPASFCDDVQDHLRWCGSTDDFDPDARDRPLSPRSVHLRRNQIHTAVSALVESGIPPSAIASLRDLVTPDSFKRILRERIKNPRSRDTAFDRDLAHALVQIAREWVYDDEQPIAELRRLAGKVPGPAAGLTDKNRRFLRQFDDPLAIQRLLELPTRMWSELKRDKARNFRTLAKAQAALAIAILMYMPIRLQNLAALEFDRHLFLQKGRGAVSSLELEGAEVKNGHSLGFDIPEHVAHMLGEYRDRVVPQILGQRSTTLFVNADGTAKTGTAVSDLISRTVQRRTGIVLTPHQFRHLSAKLMLDASPGGFEAVRQLLGQKNLKTTTNFYAGIDRRRAGRHHQRLIDQALSAPSRTKPSSRTKRRKRRNDDQDDGDAS
jgi:integrase